MKGGIITIGDEILIGQIVDTNAVYISKCLNDIGVEVVERVSIGDSREVIEACVERLMSQCDVVVVTGGLGPTKDDITKSTLASMLGMRLTYNEDVAERVRRLLEGRGIVFNELNRAQAMLPDGCEVLDNRHGTAMGMWFERGGRVVVSLPGVPFEMTHLMQDEVLPRLKKRYALSSIVHSTLITAGLAESMLAERIEQWESALPKYMKLAYLPSPGRVRLRLSAYDVDRAEALSQIEAQFAALRVIIPQYVVGMETASVEALVHQCLVERGESLAVAESCTGGAIAAAFTAMAGASSYLQCGVVAYSNASKSRILGVEADVIEREGAVSEAVVRQMAEGVRRLGGSTYGLATTGIAGPTGGSDEKPVGTVWMALASAEGTTAVCKNCGTDRGQIIARAAAEAIMLLKNKLIDK